MEIVGISLNHRVTPLSVREAIVFSQEDGEGFLVEVRNRVEAAEVMLLSTCNRTEVYTLHRLGPTAEPERAILELLRDARGFEAREQPRNYVVMRDEQAVRHLFRVAGGLESQILGESQILSQVKHVRAWARNAGTFGRILHRLWERALRVGKRIRTETAIGGGALSASYAALELARKIFGALRNKQVLIIGTGEIGLLSIENLQGVAVGGLSIMNRTRERAEEVAARHGATVVDFERLPEALVEADLVISSTSSREPIVRLDVMRRVRQQRGGNRPLLIMDLAMPRDFDEGCGRLDEVFVKNLDDLQEIVQANFSSRVEELPRAEALVEAEMETFFEWLAALEVEPTIRKLRDRYHEIRQQEIDALEGTMDPDALQQLERFTRRLVNRLLHVPSENLRRHRGMRDPELIEVIHKLLTEEIPHPRSQEEEEGAGSVEDPHRHAQ